MIKFHQHRKRRVTVLVPMIPIYSFEQMSDKWQRFRCIGRRGLPERDGNSTTYGYTMRCTYELVDKLTGLGSFCQVLESLSLRQQVRENALKIAEIYK